MSKVDKTEINEQIAASIKKFSMLAKDDVARQHLGIQMPEFIRQKAAMISAHLLLPAGARIVDMGCETGEVTYVLAQLNPRAEIIGIDRDAAAVAFARKNYKLPNLTFRHTEAEINDFEDESLDCIINSNILYGVYSETGYNTDEVNTLLDRQVRKLKPSGTMLIRDYIMPPEEEFVFLELPDTPSKGKDIAQMSDADLLILFSQSARPLPVGGCEGFFIEERRPRREETRLFVLSHKWAVEFLLRKDYRAKWHKEIREEYTFYTHQDYRRELARLGLRMTYSAPYWNPWVIKNCFKGRFQLYNESYQPLTYPATNYFIVAHKAADKQSLALEERRPSQKAAGELEITIVRDKKSGAVHELVKRPGEFCDIIPYRMTPDNRLVLYVRGGSPRPIINAQARGSSNLDGKRWSGHLIEPVVMNLESMTSDAEINRRAIFAYMKNYVGLSAKSDSSWRVGEAYFPSPERINEVIEPVFIEVEDPQKTSWALPDDHQGYAETGLIVELDGADIMLASQIGLLPEPKLEMYIIDLMARHGITPPRWVGEPLPEIKKQKIQAIDPEELIDELERTEFEEVKSAPVHLKPVKAVFVEEGRVGRTTRGLSAHDIEFIVTDDGIENIAVVLPLTRDWDNNLLVALEPQVLPVPNRVGGDGAMLNAPSFVLPSDVRSLEDVKAFIGGKFGVKPEQIVSLGESYFTHVGVTPQRIYPFTVANPGTVTGQRDLNFVMMKNIHRLLGFQYRLNRQTIKLIARTAMITTDESHGQGLSRDLADYKYNDYKVNTEKETLGGTKIEQRVASRILGERGPISPAPSAPEVAQEVEDTRRSLKHSYSQAKMDVKSDAGIAQVSNSINAVAKSLPERDKPKTVI